MNILGIETSCDETSVAIVACGRTVRAHLTTSQIALHRRFRGIVPEIASRAHVTALAWMVDAVLGAGVGGASIDGVAVTYGPGLIGSLLTGCVSAELISYTRGIPLIEVNHLEGHIFSPFLGRALPDEPFLSLIVSGGHTDLVFVSKPGVYRVLGRTRDDACGEAYDKVATLLGLGYPGGPVIDRVYSHGDARRFSFPRSVISGSYDFSFSGLKTAVLYRARELSRGQQNGRYKIRPRDVRDLAASFQEAAVSIVVQKTLHAVRTCGVRVLAVGGGVSANTYLRRRLAAGCAELGVKVFLPELQFCTDNAAMIASVGYYRLAAERSSGGTPSVFARRGATTEAPLENWHG